MYVYLQSEQSLHTVGFYDPNGEWQPESDHGTPEAAADRVAYLNGGGVLPELRGAIQQLKERVTILEAAADDLYMPTDAEWRAYPQAVAAATDGNGEVWLYKTLPVVGITTWGCSGENNALHLRDVPRPADFRTTLRLRPAGL